MKNSERLGSYLLRELRERNLSVRGKGLMIGIDVLDGKRSVLDLIEKGILTIYSRNTVRVLPPLIIEKKHADQFLDAIDSL